MRIGDEYRDTHDIENPLADKVGGAFSRTRGYRAVSRLRQQPGEQRLIV
jgi:hypothetical protein